MVRETEERHLGEVVGDVVWIDPGDVCDHEIGRFDPIRRLEAMLGQERLELPPDEEVDPTQQDRCHA